MGERTEGVRDCTGRRQTTHPSRRSASRVTSSCTSRCARTRRCRRHSRWRGRGRCAESLRWTRVYVHPVRSTTHLDPETLGRRYKWRFLHFTSTTRLSRKSGRRVPNLHVSDGQHVHLHLSRGSGEDTWQPSFRKAQVVSYE